jgi:hypothetical protein
MRRLQRQSLLEGLPKSRSMKDHPNKMLKTFAKRLHEMGFSFLDGEIMTTPTNGPESAAVPPRVFSKFCARPFDRSVFNAM